MSHAHVSTDAVSSRLTGNVALGAIAACACLVTADYLGLSMLRSSVWGLPAGLWFLVLWIGSFTLMPWLRARRFPEPAPSGNLLLQPASVLLTRAAAPAYRSLTTVARGLGIAPHRLAQCDVVLSRLHAAVPWPVRPPKVLLDLPPGMLRRLDSAEGVMPVDWRPLTHASRADAHDATVLQGALGQIVLTGTGHGPARRDSDWSGPAAYTHAGLFPPSITTDQATIVGLDLDDPTDVRVLRLATELFVALRRDAQDVPFSARLAGVLPIGAENLDPQATIDHLLIAAAQECLASPAGPDHVLGATIARLASARFTSDACTLELPARRDWTERLVLAQEPDPILLLRLAATRVAALDDAAALDAIAQADELIRARRLPFAAPQNLGFLQSEIDHSPDTAIRFGRVVAGISLLIATVPPGRVPFLKDDLLDDLRHTPWLLGRDHDLALIHRVLRALERSRETPSQPAKLIEPAIAA